VETHFRLTGRAEYTFEVESYDATASLVVDPTILLYSTYLGGSSTDTARAVAVDASGNAYVAGRTDSDDFPVTPGAFRRTRGLALGYFAVKK